MMDSVAGDVYGEDQERFSCPESDLHNQQSQRGWNFQPGSRHSAPGPASYPEDGEHCIPPICWSTFLTGFTSAGPSTFGFGFGPARPSPGPPSASNHGRVSLPPRSSYGLQSEPRAFSNTDTHVRFTQDLHHNIPFNQPSSRPSNFLQQSPDSLINNMLHHGSLQMSTRVCSPTQVFGVPQLPASTRVRQIQQLQPSRQQVTPPFNLSKSRISLLNRHPLVIRIVTSLTTLGGFAYSPKISANSASSSPTAEVSSPSDRSNLRRPAMKWLPPASSRQTQQHKDEESTIPVTPRHQTTVPQLPPLIHVSHTQSSARSHGPRYGRETLSVGSAPPMAHGIQLVTPHELPDRFRAVFPYGLFNAAQSKCFGPIYKSNDNVVVSAPTGSGKTALLELAICRLIEIHTSGQFKIVYSAPTKSLCSERVRDWQKKFSHLNLSVAELTGDTSNAEMTKVGQASIIVTTPEKVWPFPFCVELCNCLHKFMLLLVTLRRICIQSPLCNMY